MKPKKPEYPPQLNGLYYKAQAEIDNLFVELSLGLISLETYEILFQEILARWYITTYTAGVKKSGVVDDKIIAGLVAAALGGLALWLGSQIGFLALFVDAIRAFVAENGAGEPLPLKFFQRVRLYVASIVDPYWKGVTGKLPLPSLPGEGDTQCRQYCKCSWRIVWLDREAGDADAYWETHPAEHCQTCIERRKQWYPLKIKGWVLL